MHYISKPSEIKLFFWNAIFGYRAVVLVERRDLQFVMYVTCEKWPAIAGIELTVVHPNCFCADGVICGVLAFNACCDRDRRMQNASND